MISINSLSNNPFRPKGKADDLPILTLEIYLGGSTSYLRCAGDMIKTTTKKKLHQKAMGKVDSKLQN